MSNRNATVTVNTKANTGGLKQVSGALTSFDSGLKGTLGNLKQFKGALGALALVGVVKGIKSFADDMRNTYMVQAKAEKSVNDALYSNMTARGESQQAIDDQVKAYKSLASQLQKVGVIGDEVTLSGMGIMTQMGLTTDQVKTMTPLLQDLAVKQFGLNVSTDQYTQLSQSVATMVNMGKLTLQGYGIQVSDVERKQFKAMSQSERYTFIMNKLKNSVAGANEALAQTAGGKMQQMNNAIGDCEEQVGQLVNTIYGGFATMALPVIEDATGAFQEFMTVLNGGDAPDGGFQYLTADDANNIALIKQNLDDTFTSLSNIFGGGWGTLSELIGTEQFLADIANITNEVSYLSSIIENLMHNYRALRDEGLYSQNLVSVFGGRQEKGNANGTNYWEGGRTIVGEYGPEIVDLPRGSSINTNAQTQRELSGGSGTTISCPITIQGNVIGTQDFIDQVGDAISGRVSMAIANM
ncbi:MAG: hypothetical protein E6X52_08770 [Actinomyces sp.]|jgi:hypothetical protein|nr:hypothetical protein [Actinomyces sp.]MDU4964731.1 hypothetical protein [Staphylococcus warneri]DAX87331.1 MAG TPA: tape measure protein [Caudoviricetes sp.]